MKSKIEMMLEFLPQEQRDEIERGIKAMVEASATLRMRDKVRLYSCTIDELLDEQTKADLLAKQPGKKPSRKGEKNGSEK